MPDRIVEHDATTKTGIAAEIVAKTLLVGSLVVLSVVGVKASVDNHAALVILQKATSAQAVTAQQRQLAHLIHCLNNRIDYDTGHAALDPSCTPAP